MANQQEWVTNPENFGDSELQEESVIRNFRITAADGKSYDTKHYSLEYDFFPPSTETEVSVPTINEHLANLYAQGEISKEATVRNFRTVQKEGNRDVARNLDFYNLDAIIAVDFRVSSARAVQFRQWATGYSCPSIPNISPFLENLLPHPPGHTDRLTARPSGSIFLRQSAKQSGIPADDIFMNK